ncbi:hypothetical protein KAR91_72035 [Candidatus Pacearchaeota archaeon]|nr:hypothetical protein [Candidatus Pacearchaeota archaeon]
MSKRKIKTALKNWETMGVRLVTYGDETRGGRIDYFYNDNPTDAIFEGHFMYKSSAIAQFEELTTQAEATDWAYQNC